MIFAPASLAIWSPTAASNPGDFTGWNGTVINDQFAFAGVFGDPFEHSGDFAASFGPEGVEDTFFQVLHNTVVGATYTIDFYLYNDTTPTTLDPNNFSAAFGSTTGFSESQDPANSYTLESFTAIATSTTTNLTFTSENNAGFYYLDSISVAETAPPPTITPEPNSLILLGTGVAGLAGAVRRRMRGRA